MNKRLIAVILSIGIVCTSVEVSAAERKDDVMTGTQTEETFAEGQTDDEQIMEETPFVGEQTDEEHPAMEFPITDEETLEDNISAEETVKEEDFSPEEGVAGEDSPSEEETKDENSLPEEEENSPSGEEMEAEVPLPEENFSSEEAVEKEEPLPGDSAARKDFLPEDDATGEILPPNDQTTEESSEENTDIISEEMETVLSSGNLKNVAFATTNIRTSDPIQFQGSSGKVQVIIYGGIGSCSNTTSGLEVFSALTEHMDMDRINLFSVDIKNNSNDTILSGAEGIADEIQICAANAQTDSVYRSCVRLLGLSSYTMPLIVYLDEEGEIYTYSTGYSSRDDIIKNLETGGISAEIPTQRFLLTGYASYSNAYKILALINEERAKKGLSALQMDQELLAAAMQRAAECSVSYSHMRPDGSQCFSASAKMSRENIAAGQRSPEAAMQSWMNSPGHHTNIMASDNQSVGIGSVCHQGTWYWVQCFGRDGADVGVQPQDADVAFEINTDDSITAFLVHTSGEVAVGKKITLSALIENPGFFGIANVDNSSWTWSSSNPEVAEVDAAGVITGKSTGIATITGVNIGRLSTSLSYTVTVLDDNAGKDDNTEGGDPGEGNKPGILQKEGWKQIGSSWYYLNASGIRQTGWKKIKNCWYYLEPSDHGKMVVGWKKLNGKWYYLDAASGGAMSVGWKQVKGKWYYLDAASGGAMSVSWKQVKGKWYYLDAASGGAMSVGWKQVKGKWYYLDAASGGAMSVGWKQVKGKWYYLDAASGGAMSVGWKQVKGKWYYLDAASGGAMSVGWKRVKGKWYYLDDGGRMCTGKKVINGKTYRFSSSGVWIK